MAGLQGLTCPECGRAARSERAFYRTRRHPRRAALGALILLAAAGCWLGFGVLKKGWAGVVPTRVMAVAWPLSKQEWLDAYLGGASPSGPVMTEFLDRCGEGKVSDASARVWLGRVAGYLRTHGDLGLQTGDPDAVTVVVHDLGAVCPGLLRVDGDAPKSRRQAADDLNAVCERFVDPEGWLENGGTRGSIRPLGPALVVRSEARNQRAIAEFLRALAETPPGAAATLGRDWAVMRRTLGSVEMATLNIRSDLTVETAAAAVSRATGVPCVLAPELPAAAGRALLGNLAADNIAAASLLNKCVAAAETAGRGQRYRWELVDGRVVIGASVEAKPDGRLVRVYNLEHLIPFRRAEDSDAGSSSIPLGREATDPGGEQLFALMAQIEHDIEPEGWMDNGGDEGHMASLRPRLLIVCAWPRTHLAIERLLAEWKPVAPGAGAIGG